MPFSFPLSPNTLIQNKDLATQTTLFYSTNKHLNKFPHFNSYKQQLLLTATMSSPYTVQIHQSTKEPSISSSYSYSSGSYSSSTSTTPRSLSPGEYREYGAGKLPATESPGSSLCSRPTLTVDADKHTTQVAKSGRNLVINHNKGSYEKDSPAPTYAGAYTRT